MDSFPRDKEILMFSTHVTHAYRGGGRYIHDMPITPSSSYHGKRSGLQLICLYLLEGYFSVVEEAGRLMMEVATQAFWMSLRQ